MKTKKNKKLKIYQDSKEIPFWTYKRIVQTGDYFYMIKGYEPGDEVKADIEELKNKFLDIEQDYAVSINVKNESLALLGEYHSLIGDRNKIVILLRLTELTLETNLLRNQSGLPESPDINGSVIKELVKDIKVQKSDDLEKQRELLLQKVEKYNNQIQKLENQIKKELNDEESSDYDIEEQFVNVCLGLKIPVEDKNISLYQYGFMVKNLTKRVMEMNKLRRDGK